MTSYVTLDEVGLTKAQQGNMAMIERLLANGSLRSTNWQRAFERVPRHLFAPRFQLSGNRGGLTLDGRQEDQQEGWLRSVYANEPLLTGVAGDGSLLSTCSSPTVVARMLEALDVKAGHSVLEIGTGTGWNAGLLATRLGSDAVTSIDVDPAYIEAARERLASLNLHPTLALADGFAGYPERALYDRIIASCSVRQIPPAWLEQVRQGGIILADIRGNFAGGVAQITVGTRGIATGTFLSAGGSFMPLRSPDHSLWDNAAVAAMVKHMSATENNTRAPQLDPDVFADYNGFAFFAQLTVPAGSVVTTIASESRGRFFVLAHPESGTWARVELGDDASREVVQGGDRRLWDELEASYELWCSLDRPTRDQFEVIITADGEQYVSVTGAPYRWRLPL